MTFRDASAALERIAMLERENAELRDERDRLAARLERQARGEPEPDADAEEAPNLLPDKMQAFLKRFRTSSDW